MGIRLERIEVKPIYTLGVDPGMHGALALLDTSTQSIESIFDMPIAGGQVDASGLASLVDMVRAAHPNSTIHAAIENVSSMPRQRGAFNFGRSAGVVHGVLAAMGIEYTLIHSSQWKPSLGLRKTLNETQDQNKSRARELAIALWPEHVNAFKRVKDDGRAEACLIARFFANNGKW